MQPFAIRRVRIAIDAPDSLASAAPPLVLLVTDDTELRKVSARVLGDLGYEVEDAPHGGHALLVCLNRTRVDVLVAEWAMADTSGPALAERLRRHHPRLPAVYLARSGTPECEGVLVRPFTRDDLVRELEAALSPCQAS
jgi:CheY-like chemotaxis protein